VHAFKAGATDIRPVKPNTIVRSLAIGDPRTALRAADDPAHGWPRRRGRGLGGPRAIRLLGESEGLFTETAGGAVVAAARRLAGAGAFADGRPVVLLITGHGLKTVEALSDAPGFATVIGGRLEEFQAFWQGKGREAVA
jgi:threonine synthase